MHISYYGVAVSFVNDPSVSTDWIITEDTFDTLEEAESCIKRRKSKGSSVKHYRVTVVTVDWTK